MFGWVVRPFAALSGAVSTVLVFLGSAAIARTSGPGRHSLDASPADVAEYLAGADHARVWIGEYVGALGLVLFVPFAAFVVATVAEDRGGWLAGAARAAAALYVGLSAAAVAALAPALNREGAAAESFLDLRTTLIALAFVFLAAWLLAVGYEALRSGALPAWLAWAAIVIAVLELAATPLAAYDPGFTGLPTFAAFVWIVVVSVLLFRRVRPAAPEPAPV